jgi:hypothetical protein
MQKKAYVRRHPPPPIHFMRQSPRLDADTRSGVKKIILFSMESEIVHCHVYNKPTLDYILSN